MATSADENKTPSQIATGAALEAVLQPGEVLLEYTLGMFNIGIGSNQQFWIGLTNQRFIFMNPKKREPVYSLSLVFVDAVSASEQINNRLSRIPVLRLRLRPAVGSAPLREELAFKSVKAAWFASTTSMAEKYAQLVASEAFHPAFPTAQQAVQQVQELRGMGALNAAQALLTAFMQANPYIQAEPGVQDMLSAMRNTRLSMRLAAGIFGIVVLLLIYLAAKEQASLGCGIIFSIIAIVDLLMGKAYGRKLALVMGLATTALNIVLNLSAGSLPDVIAWASFGLAMLLLLTGNPGRLRIAAGGAVFAVGTLGTIAFIVLGALFFPGTLSAVLPKPTGPFVDDFSKSQGWVQSQNAEVALGLENEAYFIQVKQPTLSYFSFPPILYYPTRAEVDVRLPGAAVDPNAGAYGLLCRYQEKPEKYYVAFIDPLMEQFAILRSVEDEDSVPLTDPVMQPLRGMKGDGQANRIGFSCQNNQVTVTLNGAQQAQVSDPQMAQFGEGRLGLMVSTFDAIPTGGFKVLFDNAKFWP